MASSTNPNRRWAMNAQVLGTGDAGVTSSHRDVSGGDVRSMRGTGREEIVETVRLELVRENEEEGLGMVLGVEEDPTQPSGRRVVVKSVTPDGPAAQAVRWSQEGHADDNDDGVSGREGFQIQDRVIQVDEFVLDELDDDDCLTVLQEFPLTCVVTVERAFPPAKRPRRIVPAPSEVFSSHRATKSNTSPTNNASSDERSRHYPATVGHSSKNDARAHPDALIAPTTQNTSSSAVGDAPKEPLVKPRSLRPSSRKVRRQKSTTAHLAEKGLPGFQVRRVTMRRPEGSSLGLSIVPSCGPTKFYYQVKTLLPGGVCAHTPGLNIGDCLLECNGQSLQGLTQAQCLEVLKTAGPRVTLTLLHEQEEGASKNNSGYDSCVTTPPRQESLVTGDPRARHPNIKEEDGDGGADLNISSEGRQSHPGIVQPHVKDREQSAVVVPKTVVNLVPDAGASCVQGARSSSPEHARTADCVTLQTETYPSTMSDPSLRPSFASEKKEQDVHDQGKNFHHDIDKNTNLDRIQQQNFTDVRSDLQVTNDLQYEEPFEGNIPPPAEFSDFGEIEQVNDYNHISLKASSATTPAVLQAPTSVTPFEKDSQSAINGAKEEFDYLLDVQEAGDQKEPPSLTDIAEYDDDEDNNYDDDDEPPQLPSSPPPLPSSPPPPIPGGDDDDHFSDEDVKNSNLEPNETGNGANLHVGYKPGSPTVSTVLQSKSTLEEVEVKTKLEPLQNGHQIRTDTGHSHRADSTSRSPKSFALTSMGVTRIVRHRTSPDTEPEEDHIVPMVVTRDSAGNKVGAPTSADQLNQQSVLKGPRKLDEAAKRDLQVIMAQMNNNNNNTRAVPTVLRVSDEDGCDVSEEKITPVKLSRRDAEIAQDVLSKWVSKDSDTIFPSPPSPAKRSGFRRAAGDVIDIQAGRMELPANTKFFTTMGITRTPTANGHIQEDEEEITPMSLHKDSYGQKHYSPLPREAVGKQAGHRQLDSTAKQDIAALMSVMPEKSKKKGSFPVEHEHHDISEDEIIPTSLSKRKSAIAEEAVSRWLSKEDERARAQPSPFQRLVGSVMESSDKTEEMISEKRPADPSPEVEELQTEAVTVQSAHVPSKSSSPSLPSPRSPPPEAAQSKSPTPLSPTMKVKPTITERKTLSQTSDPAPPSQTDQRQDSAYIKPAQTDNKPVPTQRNLRAPAKITPLSKMGTLSATSRGSLPAMLASKAATKSDYGKTRSTDCPFLVEVINGILGLGIKVKVNEKGHVKVTDVQRNSPVDKNGNVRVGDHVLSVNTTELTGLSEPKVQQVLRLLPRGLIKLVVTVEPPSTVDSQQGADTANSISPRTGKAYSQYGVRLSPQPFSPTSSERQLPSLTSSVSSAPDARQPEPVSLVTTDQQQDNEMSTRKLSKALSPRSEQTSSPEALSPPKPAPRPRTSSTSPRSDSSIDDASDSAQNTPRKTDRKMTASEMVAAASRRPSGRGDDLPQPPPVSPKDEVFDDGDETSVISQRRSTYQHSKDVGSAEDSVPVFDAVARKVSPVPIPRLTPRSTGEEADELVDQKQNRQGSETEEIGKKTVVTNEVISAQSAAESHTAPAPTEAAKPKIPPPVAPKPKKKISLGSDKSYSTVHSLESPRDLPSSSSASSRLKDVSDSGEDQNRKFVTSAARMFERKASESKPIAPLTQPTRSSVPVSSVVKSFNQDTEPEPSPRWSVGPKKSAGVGDSGKSINSALMPVSERRKSTGMSSLQLTKPNSLSHLKAPLTSRGRLEDTDTEKSSSRFNSALRPRHGSSSASSSPRSVFASKDHKEDKQETSEDKDNDVDEVKQRPQPSARTTSDALSRTKRTSWSAHSEGDPHSPRMIFTSTSIRQNNRHGSSSSSSSASWYSEKDDNLESTMKKFDDLLSDKHTLDSDDELPKVSNSVSLDLLKNRSAGRVTASMKSSAEPSVQTPEVKDGSKTGDSYVTDSREKDIAVTDRHVEKHNENSSAPVTVAIGNTDMADSVIEKPQAVEEVSKVVQAVESLPSAIHQAEESMEKAQEGQKQEVSVIDQVSKNPGKQQAPELYEPVESEIADKETSMTEDVYPEEDQPAPPDMPVSKEAQCERNAIVPEDMVQEVMYRQQASSIVETVLSNALRDVRSAPMNEEAEEEDDDGPPPLPGAPPPPLILRNNVERLVEAEDLEELPTEEGLSSTKSSPRSNADQMEVSPRGVGKMMEPVNIDMMADDAAGTPAVSQSLESQETLPGTGSDVMISFNSSPSESLPLSVTTDLLVGSQFHGKDGELDTAHGEHHPVSDTLSQDSGVQDEDISEDGLRFSQDDSPTSQVESSLFDTANELPESVMTVTKSTSMSVERGSDRSTSTKSPVPSPRSRTSQSSPRSPHSSKDSVISNSSADQVVTTVEAESEDSKMVNPVRETMDNAGHNNVQSRKDENIISATHVPQDINSMSEDSVSIISNSECQPESPLPASPEHDDISSPKEEENSHSAEVKSSRKWCILDQSGSLFLQGASNSTATIAKEALRQVSSMQPGELATILAEANKDLDGAKLPKTVELRLVSARGLSGRTLSVDVTQRQDYLVQVTHVHTKDSTLEEADLLLYVDRNTLKNRRPAQVHSQLESTGPKGVLLTARGVRLPSSVRDGIMGQTVERGLAADNSNPTTPTSPTPAAVQVGPGMYDVIMKKGATGVGFCLEGGKASPKGDLPILIKRIFKGGPAEKCGQLKVGDEIMEVNGINFTNMRHYEAWNHLKFLDDGEINLRIRRQED